jgi:hypothetical protein
MSYNLLGAEREVHVPISAAVARIWKKRWNKTKNVVDGINYLSAQLNGSGPAMKQGVSICCEGFFGVNIERDAVPDNLNDLMNGETVGHLKGQKRVIAVLCK